MHPYLNGIELLTAAYATAPRYIIDFGEREMFDASKYRHTFELVKNRVLEDWQKNAEEEKGRLARIRVSIKKRLQHWWRLKRRREAMLDALEKLPRYIVCARVTKRPIFEFIATEIRPDSLSLSSHFVMTTRLVFCSRISILNGSKHDAQHSKVMLVIPLTLYLIAFRGLRRPS